ncbi:MAG: sigma-54-dependent Fis family transcriptional regulator [Planctomycetes bacterium]|nr:sigma-54-dependent Fis family transcriptional regulator [Planctomycetota bacterium]
MATPPKGHSLRVLFVDDEKHLQEFFRTELPRLGYEVTVCADGHEAFKILEKSKFDVAILDLRMPGVGGIEVLQRLKEVSPDTEAIIHTGHATEETAIAALNLGAFRYIRKPCKMAEIDVLLRQVAEKRELQHKTLALQTRVQAAEGPTLMLGKSAPMTKVHNDIGRVAPTDATVLILGETGTGKELAARTIWQQSRRAEMPFVPVNCGALAEHLVESELFGHRKGAFTGADRDHKGLFEVASGGTLFLDELGELNRNIQVKLLRFLESGEIRRVGDSESFRTDVRIVCATNCDLREMAHADDFRKDLYFRISTFPVSLPPLRERRSDIPELARHLLSRAAKRPVEQVAPLLTPEAIDVLLDYEWLGNVRELYNAMEYASIISGGGPIAPEHLPQHLRSGNPTLSLLSETVPLSPVLSSGAGSAPLTLQVVETEHILRVLEKHNNNKPLAAAELGISLKTLYNKWNALKDRKAAG